jgi:hypothetical protein
VGRTLSLPTYLKGRFVGGNKTRFSWRPMQSENHESGEPKSCSHVIHRSMIFCNEEIEKPYPTSRHSFNPLANSGLERRSFAMPYLPEANFFLATKLQN